jgi:hypothetical protein
LHSKIELDLHRYEEKVRQLRQALARAIVNKQVDIAQLKEINVPEFLKFVEDETHR